VLPHAGPESASFGSTIRATSVSAHNTGACFVTVDGTARCWGSRVNGRTGDTANTGTINVPSTVMAFTGGALTNVVAMNGGSLTTCALRSSGTSACWGANASGQTSAAAGTDSATAFVVNGTSGSLPGVIGVTSGLNHSCGMTANNQVYCWGSNALSNLGRVGGTSNIAKAVQFPTS
jgi:Regulator of chromosome condensation (RCC1) repeat